MNITFIVTGHCMEKYPDNAEYMINTLESFKFIKNFNNSRVIIALDGNKNSEYEEKYNNYLENGVFNYYSKEVFLIYNYILKQRNI